MTDVLKRIEALLARAASLELEEARTSAWTAAKLIREHKIVLRLPGDMRSAPGANPFSGASPFVDLVSDFVRVVTFGDCVKCGTRTLRKDLSVDELCPKCWTEQFNKRQATYQRKATAERTTRSARTTQHSAKWRRIEARHAGICERCGTRTTSREEVWHKKGTGIRHLKCHVEATA